MYDKEIILDKLLKKFNGNVSFTWADLHKPDFFESIDPDYFVVENHINFLLGDGALHDVAGYVALTRRGLFMMAYVDTEGYVPKKRQLLQAQNLNKKILTWAIVAAVVSVLSLLGWLLDKLI
jgi:hypothetical protein